MKTTNTETELAAIVAALAKLHIRTFGCESSTPKWNAQRNLRGKTHYVDDDTLRWHKSRVVSAHHLHQGLLYRIVCSDALDMHNTRRGFRAVVFDVFGTTIYRPKLEEAFSTSRAAYNASEKETIDLVAHYRQAIADELKHREDSAKEHKQALEAMPQAA